MVRILMNSKKYYYFLFLGFVLLNCCNNDKIKDNEITVQKNNLNLPMLFEQGLLQTNDSALNETCEIILDSIINSKNNCFLSSIQNINTEIEQITWGIIYNDDYNTRFNDNYLLKIDIKGKNIISINHENSKISEIKEKANRFIYGKNTVLKYEKRNIPYFNEIQVPITGFVIYVNLDNNLNSSNEKLKLLFKSLSELFNYMEIKRNEYANKKWKMNYDSLDFNKKIALSDIIYFRIAINIKYKRE